MLAYFTLQRLSRLSGRLRLNIASSIAYMYITSMTARAMPTPPMSDGSAVIWRPPVVVASGAGASGCPDNCSVLAQRPDAAAHAARADGAALAAQVARRRRQPREPDAERAVEQPAGERLRAAEELLLRAASGRRRGGGGGRGGGHRRGEGLGARRERVLEGAGEGVLVHLLQWALGQALALSFLELR